MFIKLISDYVRQQSVTSDGFSAKGSWVILNKSGTGLKEKIQQAGVALKDWDLSINYGIKTGCNDAFIITDEKRAELLEKCPEAASIIRPILSGDNIKRFATNWNDAWLIVSHNGIKAKGIERIDVVQKYPAIFRHLKEYEEKLARREDRGDHWSNLRNCAYVEDFYQPKIIYPEITKYLNFFFDASGKFFTSNKCFILLGQHLEYLTCLFNSPLFRFCFIDNFPELGGDRRELRKIFFQNLPIKPINNSQNAVFIELMHSIQKNPQDIPTYERKANKGIYEVYNLSDSEIVEIETVDVLWKAG